VHPHHRWAEKNVKNNQPEESDWKKFRAIVPELRERYLHARNTELITIFQNESLTPTEKFWTASKRMKEISDILSTCLDDHKRSNMMHSLRLMYHHRMITQKDLNGFSEAILERIAI
jgi:hypothetical protein